MQSVKLFLTLCLLSTSALAAPDEDPALILKRISATVTEAITKSDNYICAQDLSRFYYVPPKPETACQQPPQVPPIPPRVQDRLKLDVAVSQGTEIYSWHGEHKFSASNVGDLVRSGPISSGSFNGYLRNIFAENGIQFFYAGRSMGNNLTLYNFQYKVPLSSSHYQIDAGKDYVLAPFHGSFSAVDGTFELYSLSVIADGDQISHKTNICSVSSSLTYQMVKIADHQSLLPASFDLLMGSRTGMVTDSKGKFSECRQYSGESTVHFDMDDSATATAQAPELQTEPLKAGLILPIALRTEVDEDLAYAGQPLEAVLTRNVKINKGQMLSRGAILQGTITLFEIFSQPAHSVILKIEFNRITDGNKLYLCNATHYVEPDSLQSFYPGNESRGSRGGVPRRVQYGNTSELENGTLQFQGAHMHLGKSYSTVFITVSNQGTASQ